MARIVITGGAGFVGSHLVRRCLGSGDDVHVLVRPTTELDRLRALNGSLHIHKLFLTDTDTLLTIFEKIRPSQIFHLASSTRRNRKDDLMDVRESVEQEIIGFLSLLSASANSGYPPETLVRAGTIAEYGAAPIPFEEIQREYPRNAYAAAHVACSHYMQMLQSRLPFCSVTARLALIYGGDQSEGFLIPRLIQNCLRGQPTTIRHPEYRRDLLYVDDAVSALCLIAGRKDISGMIFNIATGTAPSVRDVADLVLRSTGADETLLSYEDGAVSEDIPEIRASASLAHKEIRWKASISIEQGIEATVEWFRNNHKFC